MSSLSIAKSRNLESAAPKKGSAKSNTSSRRKVPSTAATAKKPPRSVESKAERVAAAKTPVKIDQPQVERRHQAGARAHTVEPTRGGQHRRNDAGDGLAAAQRAGVPGGHGEKEARFFAHISEAQRWRSPLPHRNAARSLTWTNAAINVAKELARLSELTIFELRGEWRRLHRMPPPMRLSRDLLVRGITYKLQERAYGGLSTATARKLEQAGADSLKPRRG